MASKWIKLGSLYFILGISIGLFMSSTIQLQWAGALALGIILFIVNVFMNVHDEDRRALYMK